LIEERARALRERLFLDTLAAARAAGYPVIVSFTPDDAVEEMRALVGETKLIAQRGDDLGARMRHALLDALASGAAAVVLIGSDLPTLPPGNIARAFDMLEGAGGGVERAGCRATCDVVFGPTEDGGFYLVGARGDVQDIFTGISWGRSDVLARVTAAAQEAGVAVGLAPTWWDVDAPEDLRRFSWHEEFSRDDR
jgi:rSAM/selenodomain-associated transferase 1